MKKSILFFSFIVSMTASAQIVTGDVLQFVPYQSSRVHQSDSVLIAAILTSNKTVSNITWTQTTGAAVKIAPGAPTWNNGNATAISSFWVQGLAPGTYVWKATGTTISGSTAYATDSLLVIPDPVKVVCPVIPPPRVATSITLTLFGTSIVVPLPASR